MKQIVSTVVAGYLLWFGAIGMMTWAWIIGIIGARSYVVRDVNPLKSKQ